MTRNRNGTPRFKFNFVWLVSVMFFLLFCTATSNSTVWAGSPDDENGMCLIEEQGEAAPSLNETPGTPPSSDEIIALESAASGGCGNGLGYPNIAVVYCRELGYEVEVVTEQDGGQRSVCVFPDGSSCSAWRFYEGVCGESFSYCFRSGYRQIVKSDGKNPFSNRYAVCVKDGREFGNPADLMGITGKYKELPESEISPSMAGSPKESMAPLALPPSFDWRNHNGQNWVTSSKDQNACGSCWAHSPIGSTEARYNIYMNDHDLDLNLSEEYLNSDCLPNNSCCGGWHTNALEYMKVNGIPDEACLPYDSAFYSSGACDCFGTSPLDCPAACPNQTNDNSVCNDLSCSDRCADWASRLVRINDYFHVSDTDRDAMKQALITKGPLSACFGYKNFYWDQNAIGRCNPADGYTHCIVIVGYDDAGGYWIIKDSYGNDSGPHQTGYWEMGYGECNIENLMYYVEPIDMNFPPRANAGGPYTAECSGATTKIQLDGTQSKDPNAADTITYSWTTDCAGGTFDDPASATPELTLDSTNGCSISCNVFLTVTDNDGLTDSSSATVTVRDTKPPVVTCPGNITVECKGYDGVKGNDPQIVAFLNSVSVTDGCDSNPQVSNNAPAVFPVGTSVVTFTASDYCTNISSCQATVTVVDTTPPSIVCPSDITVECTGECGIHASDKQLEGFFNSIAASDTCDSSPVIANSAPEFFPMGKTMVTFTATDDAGNSASCMAAVTVVDTQPPKIDVALNRDVLWPPNHKLIDIVAAVTVTDVCDPNASFFLTSITSNEPDNGLGDGDTPDDIQGDDLGTADTQFQLRSERSGTGDGRIYTIVYTAYDSCGGDPNKTATATLNVKVPHDQSGRANGSSGFNSTGTGFAPGAKMFNLVVLSSLNFDATRIKGHEAQVGTTRGIINPLSSKTTDMNKDKLPDMVITYSVEAAQNLKNISGDGNSLAFRYGTLSETYYLVNDIFKLGPPIGK